MSAPGARPGDADPAELPYDRRLAQRLASDLLATRAELARSREELDHVRARSEQRLAVCEAKTHALAEQHERDLAELKATETWRVGAAIVALPRWVRARLRNRER